MGRESAGLRHRPLEGDTGSLLLMRSGRTPWTSPGPQSARPWSPGLTGCQHMWALHTQSSGHESWRPCGRSSFAWAQLPGRGPAPETLGPGAGCDSSKGGEGVGERLETCRKSCTGFWGERYSHSAILSTLGVVRDARERSLLSSELSQLSSPPGKPRRWTVRDENQGRRCRGARPDPSATGCWRRTAHSCPLCSPLAWEVRGPQPILLGWPMACEALMLQGQKAGPSGGQSCGVADAPDAPGIMPRRRQRPRPH